MQLHFHVLVHVCTEKSNRDVEYHNVASLRPINFSVISMDYVDTVGEVASTGTTFCVVSVHLRIFDPSL